METIDLEIWLLEKALLDAQKETDEIINEIKKKKGVQ